MLCLIFLLLGFGFNRWGRWWKLFLVSRNPGGKKGCCKSLAAVYPGRGYQQLHPPRHSKFKLSAACQPCHMHGEGIFHHQRRIHTWLLPFRMRLHNISPRGLRGADSSYTSPSCAGLNPTGVCHLAVPVACHEQGSHKVQSARAGCAVITIGAVSHAAYRTQ